MNKASCLSLVSNAILYWNRPAVNEALQSLFGKLNEAEITYPGADMQLIYVLEGEEG